MSQVIGIIVASVLVMLVGAIWFVVLFLDRPGAQLKQCPYCSKLVVKAATRCQHCGSELKASAPHAGDYFEARKEYRRF